MSNLPFVEEILADLRRFKECVEDGQDVDLDRGRFDLLTQLGLLERTRRRPALWAMTQAGEDAIAQPAAGEPLSEVAKQNAILEQIKSGLEGVLCPPAAAHGETVAYRVIGDHGTPLTDWIDGNPGPDPVAMIVGGRYVQRAYTAAHGDEAVPDDLRTRCQEIAQWRKTGVLQGDALRKYAESRWPGDPSALQMAEHETATDAFQIVATMRAQGDGDDRHE